MKKVMIHLLFVGLLLSPYSILLSISGSMPTITVPHKPTLNEPVPELKQAAFEILNNKCNVCHRKKNPFKIFSLKNMSKHAPKIYKQVFIYKRMPKGNQIKLTDKEYQALKNWLKSKNII